MKAIQRRVSLSKQNLSEVIVCYLLIMASDFGEAVETRRDGQALFFSSHPFFCFFFFSDIFPIYSSFFLFLFYGRPNDAVAFATVGSPPSTTPNFPSFHLFLYISPSLCSNTFTLLFYWFIFVSFWVSLTATTSFFLFFRLIFPFIFYFFLLYYCISNFSSHHILLLYSLFAFAFFPKIYHRFVYFFRSVFAF